MGKNWKTTACGFVAAVATLVAEKPELFGLGLEWRPVFQALVAAALATMGTVAKDAKE